MFVEIRLAMGWSLEKWRRDAQSVVALTTMGWASL
jgi:hypothetical protein